MTGRFEHAFEQIGRIIAAAVLVLGTSASATTYYVSSSLGNDANNGTAAATPWQTIAHVNAQTFQAGDSILFRRGDVWNESLVPPSPGAAGNPITFDAYGTGAPPNLTGYYAVPSSAWVHVTGNAWKAPVPSVYSTVNFCLFGSVWGQKVGASTSNLTAQWNFYLANGYLYVFSVGTPASYYAGAIVPMALSNLPVINVNGKSWLTFQHLLVNWFDQYGVYVQRTSDHLVFANMEADSMIPQGTQPLGFYVNESAQPADIRFYNDEAHLNYDGFRFDGFTFNGTGTPITMVNDKAYANRDGALVDNTAQVDSTCTSSGCTDGGASMGPGAVTYSYCHFYASSLAVAGSTDVEWPQYALGPTAGTGNVAADTPPAVQVWRRYPAQVTLTVDDAGMAAGADTYYANTVLPIADAAGVPVGAAITVGYPLAQTLVSEFQGWVNAGRDVTSHSISHTYYTNTDALDIQYVGGGSAATLSISNQTLTINVTGAADSVSYNLAQGQAQGTIQGLRQTLLATGKFTATEATPCQGPYGTGCSAYTEAALLAQDLADVSAQDVKSSAYHMQLDVTRLTTDEITLSRQWMQTNLTGLPATAVYVYPGGYETPTMQGIAAAVPYGGARGALKEDLGVKDTYASGFDAQNVTSFGVNPSWQGLQPAALNQKIRALVWKQMVWGMPWGIFWHVNELTPTEVTNLIADLKSSGATIQTNAGLVNWLMSGTSEVGTDGNFYYKLPTSSMGLDFRPTASSPVVDAGQNLGTAYQIDINGLNQNGYGSGWEIGAHAYAGYSAYGGQSGSYFKIGPSGTGAASYAVRTDTSIVQPPATAPNMGGLLGAGNCQWPGDFGSQVCRITDAAFDPSKPNFTFVTTTSGSGDTVLWNKDSTLLTVQNEGARLYPLAFDPTTMLASRLYATNSSWTSTGGFYLAGAAVSWSYSNPMVLYTLSGTQLQSYNFTGYNAGGNPPSPTAIYDFSSSANCLGSYTSTWNSFGEGSKFPADQVFVAGLSNAGGQGTGGDVVAYKVGSGCSHLNTLTGAVTGDWGTTGTIAIPDRFYVHNVKISKDGQWAMVAQAACLVNPTISSITLSSNVVTAVLSSVSGLTVGMYIDVTGVTPTSFNVSEVPLASVNAGTNTVTWAQTGTNATGSGGKIDNCESQLPYFWQIGTTNLYYSCTQGGGCGGHWTEGASHLVNANYSPFWQQDIRAYGNNPAGTTVIPGLPLSGCSVLQADQHQNWTNVDLGDIAPLFTSTAAVGNNAQVPGSYNCAWVNEVMAISPTSGMTYRFAHTNTTGKNWNFEGEYAIGGESQDGRFYAFTSDWQRTLGTEGGANGTCTDSPNSSTACRNDVFVVATAAHPNLYVIQVPYSTSSNSWWTDVQTYLYPASSAAAGASIVVQWADFDNGSSGTVAVTNGSTAATVTCSAGCSNQSAWTGMMIAGKWYEVASISGNSVTLARAFAETTNSAAAFNAYDFSTDDPLIAAWNNAGKRANIIVWAVQDGTKSTSCSNYALSGVTACATPGYLWTALGTSNYTTCWENSGGTSTQQIPNFNSLVFQSNYENAMAALVAHYQTNPRIGYIRFGLGRGGETFPAFGWDSSSDAACQTAFQSWGFSNRTQWQTYLGTMLSAEAALGSQKQLMLALNGVDPPNTQVPDYVASVAAPLGIGIGSQGWQAADISNCSGAQADWCNLFQTYEYQVPLELQTATMSCAAGTTCTTNAVTGSLPPLLVWAAANHTNIFEIYWEDWLIAYDAAYQASVGVSSTTGASYLQALQATANGWYSQ